MLHLQVREVMNLVTPLPLQTLGLSSVFQHFEEFFTGFGIEAFSVNLSVPGVRLCSGKSFYLQLI